MSMNPPLRAANRAWSLRRALVNGDHQALGGSTVIALDFIQIDVRCHELDLDRIRSEKPIDSQLAGQDCIDYVGMDITIIFANCVGINIDTSIPCSDGFEFLAAGIELSLDSIHATARTTALVFLLPVPLPCWLSGDHGGMIDLHEKPAPLL
jgi:hypothetical protein